MGYHPGLSLRAWGPGGVCHRLLAPTRGETMFGMETTGSARFQLIGGMISRRQQGRLIAGVAGGIADRLGVADLYVRAGFLVLALIWGIGVIVYLVLWAVTLDRTDHPPSSPPVSAERRAGYLLMFAGGLLVLRTIGVWSGDQLVWPGAAVILGVAFLVDRRDIDPRSAILALFDPNSGRFRSRTIIGIVLLALIIHALARGRFWGVWVLAFGGCGCCWGLEVGAGVGVGV